MKFAFETLQGLVGASIMICEKRLPEVDNSMMQERLDTMRQEGDFSSTSDAISPAGAPRVRDGARSMRLNSVQLRAIIGPPTPVTEATWGALISRGLLTSSPWMVGGLLSALTPVGTEFLLETLAAERRHIFETHGYVRFTDDMEAVVENSLNPASRFVLLGPHELWVYEGNQSKVCLDPLLLWRLRMTAELGYQLRAAGQATTGDRFPAHARLLKLEAIKGPAELCPVDRAFRDLIEKTEYGLRNGFAAIFSDPEKMRALPQYLDELLHQKAHGVAVRRDVLAAAALMVLRMDAGAAAR